ncbi:hypothetical protein PFDG_01017, partial [Plasmodium falciparum Dd2]
KFCLNCGVQLGGGVLQASGLLGGIGSVAVNGWKTEAIAAAIAAAEKTGAAEGSAKGAAAGAAEVIRLIKTTFHIEKLGNGTLDSIINTNTYTDVTHISGFIDSEF